MNYMSLFLAIIASSSTIWGQAEREHKVLHTSLGSIAVYLNIIDEKPPIVFLHGVYLDHHLWDYQLEQLTEYSTISIDMPLHGNSTNSVPKNWTLNDCAQILIEILDALKLSQVIAIGHSWGAMTILRAAAAHPQRFLSVGFCNMPFKGATPKIRARFRGQHCMLIFRKFYTRQVAKVLFAKESLEKNASLLSYIQKTMGQLTAKNIRLVDKMAIIDAKDVSEMIKKLKIPAMALKGEDDYVAVPPQIGLSLVEGGHVSPLEAADKVLEWVHQVIQLSKN